jgi:hypothetical protein
MLFDPGGGAQGVIRTTTGTYRAFIHTVPTGTYGRAFINTAGTYSFILFKAIKKAFTL